MPSGLRWPQARLRRFVQRRLPARPGWSPSSAGSGHFRPKPVDKFTCLLSTAHTAWGSRWLPAPASHGPAAAVEHRRHSGLRCPFGGCGRKPDSQCRPSAIRNGLCQFMKLNPAGVGHQLESDNQERDFETLWASHYISSFLYWEDFPLVRSEPFYCRSFSVAKSQAWW